MKQLNLFDKTESKNKPKRKVGRPLKLSPDTVYQVIDDINKKLKNKFIIQKNNISESTFYRIKRGEYDHLFKEAVADKIEDFSLDLCMD